MCVPIGNESQISPRMTETRYSKLSQVFHSAQKSQAGICPQVTTSEALKRITNNPIQRKANAVAPHRHRSRNQSSSPQVDLQALHDFLLATDQVEGRQQRVPTLGEQGQAVELREEDRAAHNAVPVC
jgi:hypothetical protein